MCYPLAVEKNEQKIANRYHVEVSLGGWIVMDTATLKEMAFYASKESALHEANRLNKIRYR